MHEKVAIRRLPTGVPGLDDVLGGGLPEFSFNLIAGAPGSGKTTLAQQIMFAIADADRPALYFTVLGEPPLKMLRYQQQFTFFDLTKVNDVRPFHQSRHGGARRLVSATILDGSCRRSRRRRRDVVIVDSFRTVVQDCAERSGRCARCPALHSAAGRPSDRLGGDDVSRR